MWSKEGEINTRHLANEMFYICRILAVVFWLLGLVRAGDTLRQYQYLQLGLPTTINPFWITFNSITALAFFVVGLVLWFESRGAQVKRDTPALKDKACNDLPQ